MSVTNKTLFKSNLYPKIGLLSRRYQENDDGDFTETIEELGNVWAKVKEISHLPKKYMDSSYNLEDEKVRRIYKIVMRKTINRNARHAYLSALRWNYKILDIFVPFQESDCGKWLEGIAVECKKEV
jgi:head-tail adaptor